MSVGNGTVSSETPPQLRRFFCQADGGTMAGPESFAEVRPGSEWKMQAA
jgi:hypothetical protein